MSANITPAFTAARVEGRYRVLDTDGAIVATLSSKAKAEAKAQALTAEAELAAIIAADVAMEAEMDAECPQEEARPFTAEENAALAALEAEELAAAQAEIDAAEAAREAQVQAELDAQAAARAAEERQEEPAAPAPTEDTPQAEKPVEKLAKVVKAKAPKADQPEPHAFSTVGTTIKNHCASCGRSWAAASHRKFREAAAAGVAPEAAEEWVPAADDTTASGEAPALDAASA